MKLIEEADKLEIIVGMPSPNEEAVFEPELFDDVTLTFPYLTHFTFEEELTTE